MRDRHILYLSLQTWVQIISWLLIFWNVLSFIMAYFIIVGSEDQDFDATNHSLHLPTLDTKINLGYPILVDAVLNFLAAVILLRGAKNHRIMYLAFWIAHIIVWNVVKLILIYFLFLDTHANVVEEIQLSAIETMFPYFIPCFFVGLFIHDIIKADPRRHVRAEECINAKRQ